MKKNNFSWKTLAYALVSVLGIGATLTAVGTGFWVLAQINPKLPIGVGIGIAFLGLVTLAYFLIDEYNMNRE